MYSVVFPFKNRNMACWVAACCVLVSAIAREEPGPPVAGVGPRSLAAGSFPNDIRLQELKDLDGYFPFTPPTDKVEWAARSESVRQRLAISLGLWPMPAKTPLNAVIHGKIERDNYTIEKVYFESVPGFLCHRQLVQAER